jgi:hypothetical protein
VTAFDRSRDGHPLETALRDLEGDSEPTRQSLAKNWRMDHRVTEEREVEIRSLPSLSMPAGGEAFSGGLRWAKCRPWPAWADRLSTGRPWQKPGTTASITRRHRAIPTGSPCPWARQPSRIGKSSTRLCEVLWLRAPVPAISFVSRRSRWRAMLGFPPCDSATKAAWGGSGARSNLQQRRGSCATPRHHERS